MKIWSKIHLKEQNKKVELIAKSLTNYLYGYGPILDLTRKYKISQEDRKILDEYTSNRIAGLLLLYLVNDIERINDIVNKYNIPDSITKTITPEIEGYLERWEQ